MKKYLIAALVLGLFVVQAAWALTPVGYNCSLWNRDLRLGSVGDDVRQLQVFLSNQGHLRVDSPTAYFGPLTLAAVTSFQSANGIQAVGNVGPLTRAKIGQLSGCATSGNLPPVISGIAGPATLQAGEQGTWTIQASDPENGTLSYSASWGDAPATTVPHPLSAGAVIWQNSTLTHTYTNPGTYRPNFVATDSAGQSTVRAFTVTVTGEPNNSSVTVTSPNGGEAWKAASVEDIIWRVDNENIKKVDIYLADRYSWPPCTGLCPAVAIAPDYVLDKNIDADSIYHWIVATDIINKEIHAGDYLMKVCEAGSFTNCDLSDRSFEITPEQKITLTSPRDGEELEKGVTTRIRWTSPKKFKNEKVKISLLESYGSCQYGTCYRHPSFGRGETTIVPATTNDGSYSWKPNKSGEYFIQVCIDSVAIGPTCDLNEIPFTITD